MSEPLPEWVDVRVNELLKQIAALQASLDQARKELEKANKIEVQLGEVHRYHIKTIAAQSALLEEAKRALEDYASHAADCVCAGDNIEHGPECKNCICGLDEALARLASSSPAPEKRSRHSNHCGGDLSDNGRCSCGVDD